MGATSSIVELPDKLTKEEIKNVLGDEFQPLAFARLANDEGQVSKEKFMAYIEQEKQKRSGGLTEEEIISSDPDKKINMVLDCQDSYNKAVQQLGSKVQILQSIAEVPHKGMHHEGIEENTYEAVRAQAAVTKPRMDSLIETITASLSEEQAWWKKLFWGASVKVVKTPPAFNENLLETTDLMFAPLKSKGRTVQKANQKYKGDIRYVCDVCRCSLSAKTPESIRKVYDRVKAVVDSIPEVKILRVKNGFLSHFTPGGYRDIKIALQIDNHVCELQLHLEVLLKLKEKAHEAYEWARYFNPKYGLDLNKLANCLDPTEHTGSGSVLFRAIESRNVDLIRCFLLHPKAKEVVNGTSDSWPPFNLAMTMGHVKVSRLVMNHPNFKFDRVPWQFESFVLKNPNYRAHPDLDTGVPYEDIVEVAKEFFTKRIAAGFPEPTFQEYMDCINGKGKSKEELRKMGVGFY